MASHVAKANSHITPWAGWSEWSSTYDDLFALDEPSRRADGVRRVELWRIREQQALPLAVDATATFTELALLDAGGGLSEHALCLMYAMSITRLVNGITDPLQQNARAVSVKRLAQTVGLPAALVELRHECTHNSLPSIGRLRLAADESLLWLHTNYWLPQRELRDETSHALRACLSEYASATVERCAATGEPPLRKHVTACAQALDKALAATQLGTQLAPTLLDGGFLAPPLPEAADSTVAVAGARVGGGAADSSAADPAASAAAGEAMAAASAAAGGDAVRAIAADGELCMVIWAPLVTRLIRLWPRYHFTAALLVGAAERLRAEASVAVTAADAGAGVVAGAAGGGGGARLRALQRWCVHLMDADDAAAAGGAAGGAASGDADEGGDAGGGDGGSGGADISSGLLDGAALTRATWHAVRAPRGWGGVVVKRAVRHAAWPSTELAAQARRLVQIGETAERVRRGETTKPPGDAAGGATPTAGETAVADSAVADGSNRPPPLAASTMPRVAATCLAPPLAANSLFRVCEHWVPTAIGAPPPHSSLAAVLASMPPTGMTKYGGAVATAALEEDVAEAAMEEKGDTTDRDTKMLVVDGVDAGAPSQDAADPPIAPPRSGDAEDAPASCAAHQIRMLFQRRSPAAAPAVSSAGAAAAKADAADAGGKRKARAKRRRQDADGV